MFSHAGCDSSAAPRPDLELDVAQYLARVKRWAPIEHQASVAIGKIFRTHLVDVAAVTGVTGSILPDVDKHLVAISAFTPRTPEIIRVHDRYVDAWERLRDGFQDIQDGMHGDDAMRLAEGRRRLDAWAGEMVQVATELRELADRCGISTTTSAAVPLLEWLSA
jgi:hypothetical protein